MRFLKNIDNFEMSFGTSVLLQSKSQATFHCHKISDEVKEQYREFPIYNLFNLLKN